MADKIFVKKFVPEYFPQNLKWYERDGLLTYIDQIKYERFSEDPDRYLKIAEVANFNITYNHCRGTSIQNSNKHYQTVCISDVKKMPQKERKKAVDACLRSERKGVHVEKKLAFSHYLGEKK